jgi:CRP/FNR family cyclic AMP-dependent transcriptional regulator
MLDNRDGVEIAGVAREAGSIELDQISLFQHLSQEELERIRPHLHRRSVPAGAFLMLAEDPGEAAYVILTGTVKVFIEAADGTETILALRGAGEIVGEMSLLAGQSQQPGSRSASVLALEPCVILSWDRRSFSACLDSMPPLSRNLLRILSRRLRLTSAQVEALARLDLDGRVARQLLAFAEEYGEQKEDGSVLIPLRLTQSDLAGFVGASRVRVNRVIVQYRKRGWIAVDRQHRIAVLDANALALRCR